MTQGSGGIQEASVTFAELQRSYPHPLAEVLGDEAECVRRHFRLFGMRVDDGSPVGRQGFLRAYVTFADDGIALCDLDVWAAEHS